MLHDAVFEQKATSHWWELSQETSHTVSIFLTIPTLTFGDSGSLLVDARALGLPCLEELCLR